MMNLTQKIKKFWENTNDRNAHLGKSGEEEYLLERAKVVIGNRIKGLRGKTVIDFGCGGGYLGKYLLEKKNIGKYIAFDVAERSLSRAKENLKEFADRTEFVFLREHVWDFSKFKPDVIACLAVIIHFPSQLYLDNFLRTCDRSGAKHIVLEIRNRGRGTVLQSEPYSADCFKASPKTCLTCETSPEYVTARLSQYRLIDKTDPVNAPTNCQILWFTLKTEEQADEHA